MKTVLPADVSPDTSDPVTRLQQFNIGENLIECNSQLVSRIHGHESAKLKHGPGHFLQKVFLQKLKSKSVPSLNKNEENINESIENERLDEEVRDDVINAENWFKTWPDCVDKVKEPDKINGVTNGVKNETNGNLSHEISNGNVEENLTGDAIKPPLHTPTSMDNALHNLPIAYSPLTKQILIVNTLSENPPKFEQPVPSPKATRALHRVGTEAGSFSSTVSSLSDYSPLTAEDGSSSSAFLENGDSCSLISIGTCSIGSQGSISGDKPKRRGISGFFSRSVFGWKGKAEGANGQNQEGWSLFGKSAISRSLSALPRENYSDEQASVGSDGIQGSSGLIPLERPEGLPEKSKEERQAHASQHDTIIRSARKKELKEAKERKKILQHQLKTEDELVNATRVWIHDILPKWHQVKNTKKTHEMWWLGIPPGVRGKVWRLAISNDLNLTRELYDICVTRAKDRLKGNKSFDSSRESLDRESSLDLIQLDISRTFPNLCIFQEGGPYYSMLHDLLAAYACYRPDVGYVQGMSFIAAVLILNMDVADAFVCFANVLNRPCHRSFYSMDQPKMELYYAAYNELLKENYPRLWSHLESTRLTPDLYLLDWLYTIYAKAMNLDMASRVWDLFLRDGDDFLFRTAIGILGVSESFLMKADFLAGSQYLTRLPEDLSPSTLFKAISQVKMTSNKRTFSQIFTSYLTDIDT